MAVKPINKSVVTHSGVKREKQLSTKHRKSTGNDSRTYLPGKNNPPIRCGPLKILTRRVSVFIQKYYQ